MLSGKMPTYKKWCQENGFVQANGVPRKTAEIVWRYISGNNEFEESHTGLEDVLIEAETCGIVCDSTSP